MKLSVHKEPGFEQGIGYNVFKDGEKLERVVKVDTDAGIAWVHETDTAGRSVIDPETKEIVLREVYGVMRVEKI